MKVIQPLTITEDNLIESNLYDVAPALYNAGTTYALGAYVGVAGTLGEILIYKSLQASNTGNTPASSPAWWEYSSKTYEVHDDTGATAYGFKYRVINPANNEVYESVVANATNAPLDVADNPPWLQTGTSYDSLPADWNFNTIYAVDALIYRKALYMFEGVPSIQYHAVYKSLQNSNSSRYPETNPTWWERVDKYPVPYERSATYEEGRVVEDANNITYTSLMNNNISNPLSNTPAWFSTGVTNRFAMFDAQSTTTSVAAKEIEVTIQTGIIDTIACINLDATLAEVTVRNGLGGAIVFEKVIGLTGGNPTNAWDYYFTDPTIRFTQFVIEGIPPYVNSHVTIRITAADGVGVGNIIIGKAKSLGITTTGAQAGILDFSTKTTDAFGFTTFVQRGYKKTLSVQTEINKVDINKTQNTLYSLRATPCLWLSTNDPALSEPMVIYGFYKNFSTDITYPTHSLCSLDIEGLI